jgi:hypothetical protein
MTEVLRRKSRQNSFDSVFFCAMKCGQSFHDCDVRIQIYYLLRDQEGRSAIWASDDMVILPKRSSLTGNAA